MRLLISAVCLGGALLLIAASMLMNWSFWTWQGTDALNGRIFGTVSLGIDVFKCTLPLVIAWAWAQHFRLGYMIGTVFFVGCLGFSFFSAIGFAASSRDAVTGAREVSGLGYAAAGQDIKDIEDRLQALGSPRPHSVIEEAIVKAEQDRRWSSSQQCRAASSDSSRAYCRSLADLRIELAAATESAGLQDRKASLKAEMDRLVAAGARLEQDPQAGILARLSGFGVGQIQTGLVVLLALLVELGAAFGLFIAMLPLRRRSRFEPHSQASDRADIEVLPPSSLRHRQQHGPTRFVRAADGRLMIE